VEIESCEYAKSKTVLFLSPVMSSIKWWYSDRKLFITFPESPRKVAVWFYMILIKDAQRVPEPSPTKETLEEVGYTFTSTLTTEKQRYSS
jgi:hypothetical protein